MLPQLNGGTPSECGEANGPGAPRMLVFPANHPRLRVADKPLEEASIVLVRRNGQVARTKVLGTPRGRVFFGFFREVIHGGHNGSVVVGGDAVANGAPWELHSIPLMQVPSRTALLT
jgi:hypothetical protein